MLSVETRLVSKLAGAFGKRIMELLQHDGSERSLVIFGLSASVGRPEIQQNRDILEYIIDANDDIILKDLVPIRKAIITIDKGNWCGKKSKTLEDKPHKYTWAPTGLGSS